MRHVCILIPTIDRIGGAESQAILLAQGLRRRGWRVSFVALTGSGGVAARQLAASGVEFLSLGMRKGLADPRGWIRFQRWVRREKPDVVHAHLAHAAWLARWSRLAAPVRVVIDTLHSSSTGSWGRRIGYRLSNWLGDQTTAVSRAVAEAHLAAGFMTEANLTVLANGVDTSLWRPDGEGRAAIRREMGLGCGFVWLAAGRLEPVKDYPTLLQAFALTPDTALLAIAGQGRLMGDLERLVAGLGLDRRVRFLGFEANLLPWMRAADGFVLSSRWEGLPMGILEAAACALPAVATDVPGTREAIVHGRTGWLTPAGDAGAMGKAMVNLMQGAPPYRAAMGEQARQFVMGHFSLERALDRWEALYDETLEKNPKPKREARSS